MRSETISAAVYSILKNAIVAEGQVDVTVEGHAAQSVDLAKLPDLGLAAAMWEVAYQLSVMNERAEQEAAMVAGASLGIKH